MKKYLVLLVLIFAFLFNMSPALAVTSSTVATQQSAVNQLKQEIEQLDAQSTDLEKKINDLNKNINQTAQDLLKAQQEEQKQKEQGEARLRATYMYGSEGYLSYLFSARDTSEFISYYDVAKDIIEADNKSSAELKKNREQIQQLQQKLTQQRDSLVQTKKLAEQNIAQKQQTLNANQDVLIQLQNELDNQNLTEATDVGTVSVPQEQQNSVIVQSSTPTVLGATQEVEETAANAQGSDEVAIDPVDEKEAQNVIASSEEELPEDVEETESSAAVKLPRYAQDQATNGSIAGDTHVFLPVTDGQTISVLSSNLAGTWTWPLDASGNGSFTITSLIGTRESPGGIGSTDHGGIDIGAAYGTPILAANDGTVTISGAYGGYGNAVMIDHGNGYETLYGHMSAIAVTQGTSVRAGQIIGYVGSTGWSTGAHLHFEVHYTDENGTVSRVNGLSLYGQDIYSRLSYQL